jgi:hypothetical protein
MYLKPIVEANLAIPKNPWTKFLRLDSRASNQKMFLIHSHLQTIDLDPTGEDVEEIRDRRQWKA